MADFGAVTSVTHGALAGGTSGSTSLVSITTTTSTNTKSAWTEIIASTGFDAGMLVIYHRQASTSANHYGRLDIGIGGSGSEVVLVPDMMWTRPGSTNNTIVRCVPIQVPAGSRLSARHSWNANGGGTMQVGIYLLPTMFGGVSFSRCAQIGSNASTDYGAIVDPGASAHTKGAWVELTSSCPFDVKAIQISGGYSTNYTGGDVWLDLGVGGSGSEVVVLPDWVFDCATTNRILPPLNTPILPVQFRAGDRIAVRMQSSNATVSNREMRVAVHLFG